MTCATHSHQRSPLCFVKRSAVLGRNESRTKAGFRKQVIRVSRWYFPSSFLLGSLETAFLQRADVAALAERQLRGVTGFGLGPLAATTDFGSSELALLLSGLLDSHQIEETPSLSTDSHTDIHTHPHMHTL